MIILINPPNPPGYISNKDTAGGFGQLYTDLNASTLPPIDIPYIGAVLKKNNIPVKIYDCPAISLSIEKLINLIKTESPGILGIRTSTPTIDWDMSLVERIKNEGNNPQVVVFGPHATLHAREIVTNNVVDAVILGEPEYAFVDLVKKRWEDIEGLVYKQNGKIYANNHSRIIEDLDSLPFPAWELMPLHAYSLGDYIDNQAPFVTLLSSRGCPFGCKYCPYVVSQGRKWRARSVGNVLDEIQYLVDKFGVKGLLFRDPEFAINNNRVAKICQGMIEKGIKLSWRCETRIDTVDEKLLTLMARAGCRGINFGIESASDKVLAGVGRKSVPQKEIIERITVCKKLGISTFCFFIIGLPDDDAETIIDTINLSLKLDSTSTQFTIFTPYYGTELHSWYEQNRFIEDKRLESFTSYKSVVRTKRLNSAELQKFSDLACQVWKIAKSKRVAELETQRAELETQRAELETQRAELETIKRTYWYKISYKCYKLWKKVVAKL
jgi:radical SAM superfamily enzyme YgiQ (UPF0313 family)